MGAGIRNRERHLARLRASAHYFAIRLDEDQLRAALARVEDCADPARVRLLVDRSGAVTLEHAPLPVTIDGPVRLAIDPPGPAPDLWCRHKTTRRDRYTRAAARHPQAEDVILTDPHGRVLETSTANIAVLLDGRWWTPPAELGCLPGVERARLLDAGLLSEAELSVEDLPAADGLAVLNSLRGWRPAELITQPQP